MKYQGELSIVGACEGYSKTPAKHAPAVGNSVLNSPINNLGSGSVLMREEVGYRLLTAFILINKDINLFSRRRKPEPKSVILRAIPDLVECGVGAILWEPDAHRRT